MSRYIDACAILNEKGNSFKFGDETYYHESIIQNAPTVDAVPVVRCGECYYKDEKSIMDKDALWCRKHHMYVTADWFCADGDRK